MGIGASIVISRRKAAASAAASSATGTADSSSSGDAYPPDGTTGNPADPYSLDPSTGITYGDEGGLSAGTGYGDYGGGYDDPGDAGSGTGDDAAGYPIGSEADLQWQATQGSSTAITTNTAWMQEALTLLPGGASAANSAALSNILAGVTVTAAQVAIFNQAVALTGEQPPQGYPPINQSTTAAQPTGSGSAGKTTVNTAPTGFRVKSVAGNNVTLEWNALPGATGYTIAYGKTLASAQQYKQSVQGGATTSATVADVGGATPGGVHYFELWADPAQANGPHAGPIQVTLQGAKPK